MKRTSTVIVEALVTTNNTFSQDNTNLDDQPTTNTEVNSPWFRPFTVFLQLKGLKKLQ